MLSFCFRFLQCLNVFSVINECQRYPQLCIDGSLCVEVPPEVNSDGYECLCGNGLPPQNGKCHGMYITRFHIEDNNQGIF